MFDFNEQIIDDAAGFVDALGGEDISYCPANGVPRTIKAIIDRKPPEYTLHGEMSRNNKITVTVANDATIGIATATIDIGGDTVQLPARWGKDAGRPRRFAGDPLMQDAGMLTLTLA